MLEFNAQHASTDDPVLPRYDERCAYHFASEYRDRGWPVIPLVDKKPALTSWKRFQDCQPTYDDIARWFGGRKPRHGNLGIVTGPISGLAVVDCDCDADTQYWLDHFPKSPLMSRTGGGGLHIYYRLPEARVVRNRARLGGRKIDVRGEGGYVVAPPSRHASGNLYTWTSWGDYCLDEIPVLDPAWFASPKPVGHSTSHLGGITDGPAYIRHIRAIAGQHGHNATFRAACKLRDAGLSPEEALAELIVWNQTNAEPPWSPRELLHKVQSAYRCADHCSDSIR